MNRLIPGRRPLGLATAAGASWSTALAGGAVTLTEIPPPPEVTR